MIFKILYFIRSQQKFIGLVKRKAIKLSEKYHLAKYRDLLQTKQVYDCLKKKIK